MKPKIYIVGAGMGGADGLTCRATEIIKNATNVFAFQRIAESLKSLRSDIEACSYSDIFEKLKHCGSTYSAVLVSGDTGFFSVSQHFIKELEGDYDIELIAGVNSLQSLCAKLGTSYENLKVISRHGRSANFLGAVSYNRRIFMLTDVKNNAASVCAELVYAGLGDVTVTVAEDLSLHSERIISGTARDLANETFGGLTVLMVENSGYQNHYGYLSDSDFIRGEGTPMTKEEVRIITLAKINAKPTDIIYDIGAGTGSVAVELARAAYDGAVYAIERDDDAYSLLLSNRERFGTYNMTPIHGTAPSAQENLPKPDKVFIGGSSGNLELIIENIDQKNSEAVIVINAITLDTLNEALAVSSKYGKKADVVCVNISKSKNVGGYKMMYAANPVYVISVNP